MIRSSSSNDGIRLLSSLHKSMYEGLHGTVNLNKQLLRNTPSVPKSYGHGSGDYDKIEIELCFKFKAGIMKEDIELGFKNGKTFCSKERIRFRGMYIPIKEARAECLRLKKEAFKAFNDWCIENGKTEEDMNNENLKASKAFNDWCIENGVTKEDMNIANGEAELEKFKASKVYQEIEEFRSWVLGNGKTFSS